MMLSWIYLIQLFPKNLYEYLLLNVLANFFFQKEGPLLSFYTQSKFWTNFSIKKLSRHEMRFSAISNYLHIDVIYKSKVATLIPRTEEFIIKDGFPSFIDSPVVFMLNEETLEPCPIRENKLDDSRGTITLKDNQVSDYCLQTLGDYRIELTDQDYKSVLEHLKAALADHAFCQFTIYGSGFEINTPSKLQIGDTLGPCIQATYKLTMLINILKMRKRSSSKICFIFDPNSMIIHFTFGPFQSYYGIPSFRNMVNF